MLKHSTRRALVALCVAAATAACRSSMVVVSPAATTVGSNDLAVEIYTAADTLAQFAYVRAAFDGTPTTVTLLRRPDGRYGATIPAAAQRVAFSVSVPEHGLLETQATLPVERPVVFRLRPRPLFPSESLSVVRAVGDFNGFTARPSDTLHRDASGRLRLVIPFSGDSARFQLRGLGGPSAGAWMSATSYALAPDTSGERTFAGVIRPVRDSLFFELDGARLRYDPKPPLIVTMTADSALNLANALSLERFDAFRQSGVLRFFRPTTRDSVMPRALAHARALLTTPQHPRVRTEALVTVVVMGVMGGPPPVTESRALLAEHGPHSPITRDRIGLDAITRALYFADTAKGRTAADTARWQERLGTRLRAYVMPTARDVHADTSVRLTAFLALAYQLAATPSRAGLDTLIAEAEATFPRHPYVARLAGSLGTQRTLRPGVVFPAFRLRALGDTSTVITNDAFAGKLTLIDFWATWCTPCIAEMPVLHQAHERFKERGFQILSISADESIEPVVRLRRGKWPMPWLHAWSAGGPDSPALKALGVIGFPTAVLVDSTGRIVAVGAGLRGAGLEQTITRLLLR